MAHAPVSGVSVEKLWRDYGFAIAISIISQATCVAMILATRKKRYTSIRLAGVALATFFGASRFFFKVMGIRNRLRTVQHTFEKLGHRALSLRREKNSCKNNEPCEAKENHFGFPPLSLGVNEAMNDIARSNLAVGDKPDDRVFPKETSRKTFDEVIFKSGKKSEKEEGMDSIIPLSRPLKKSFNSFINPEAEKTNNYMRKRLLVLAILSVAIGIVVPFLTITFAVQRSHEDGTVDGVNNSEINWQGKAGFATAVFLQLFFVYYAWQRIDNPCGN